MKSEVSTILAELKNHLVQNYGDSIKDVILFGSQANGNAQKFSDFDVLIVLRIEYSGKDENRILDLCYDINLKFNIVLDVHIISDHELNTIRGSQPIFVNAIKTGTYA